MSYAAFLVGTYYEKYFYSKLLAVQSLQNFILRLSGIRVGVKDSNSNFKSRINNKNLLIPGEYQ